MNNQLQGKHDQNTSFWESITDSHIITHLLIVIVLSITFMMPVSAHSATPGSVDHPNGIDDLWPYHAALMTGGIACFLGAAGIVQFGRKTRWWYKVHPAVALSGGILIHRGHF